ncbi:ABC transporter ATP-binding protein [Pontibacter sp. G13]|uniref:ABC transporter ATP-binding protein n=1 Tax=Pontibacter sp. G13 TaxID=3074898 RepID=UPI00288B7311|nr:ABC transporter ATP-binding protein [Pontibacter sp. G13]WNJ16400.1 ABC transporter ATP-binding protein [Pontibacter sp. G13]
MSDIAIQVEHISKMYQLGAIGAGTLRETFQNAWRSLNGKHNSDVGKTKEFWALRDVNFEVKHGEVVGIVGKNGAGKSTLLKVLSKITEPTEGRIKLGGRIASLLEVGTGFHPELTGRENIFLNGSILGMTRVEIKQKFDEIVEFSGVEKFLDTPVKRYSSGMYVRLAFAVAAHLEPEILVIDEVLAVGDMEFQKKCLGKMKDVAGQGRTVLFVSHNMAAVNSLCSKAIFLQNGQVHSMGPTSDIIPKYMDSSSEGVHGNTVSIEGDKKLPIRPTGVQVLVNETPNRTMKMGDNLTVRMFFDSNEPTDSVFAAINIISSNGDPIIATSNEFLPFAKASEPTSQGFVDIKLGVVPLNKGTYYLSIWLGQHRKTLQIVREVMSFQVEAKDIWGKGKLPAKASHLYWEADFHIGGAVPQEII